MTTLQWLAIWYQRSRLTDSRRAYPSKSTRWPEKQRHVSWLMMSETQIENDSFHAPERQSSHLCLKTRRQRRHLRDQFDRLLQLILWWSKKSSLWSLRFVSDRKKLSCRLGLVLRTHDSCSSENPVLCREVCSCNFLCCLACESSRSMCECPTR